MVTTLNRERGIILVALIALAAVGWALIGQQAAMPMELSAPVFFATWVLMMVAMMFPTAAPMILVFAQVQASRRAGGGAFVPTWIFVAAYLLIWTAFGAVGSSSGIAITSAP